MIYVTMTDRFMSGWGLSEGKINKLVFECSDRMEAERVMDYAERRKDQSYINLRTTRPSYPTRTHYTQFKTKTDYPNWYK